MKSDTLKKAAWLLIACILTGQYAISQENRKLSLKEAIELGLKNSKELKRNQSRIGAATAAVKEAEEKRLPDFSVSGSVLHLNNPDIELKAKQSGGSGTPSSSPTRISNAAYSIANVSLPIYAGGRIRFGIESARYLAEAVKLDADNNRAQVIQNLINAYSNLYKAGVAVELVNENLKQSRQRVEDFSNLEKNGLLARNDLLKAELQTSNIELSVLDAENNLKMANINMNLLLGLPESTVLAPDSSGFSEPASLQPVDMWEQLALQNRKDLDALSYRKKSAEVAVKSAKSELYPSLALTGGYIAAYVPNFLTVTNAVNIGVGVQYHISSLWKANAKIQQAKARADEAEISEKMLGDAINLQVNQAYHDYLLNRKKIDVFRKAVEQSSENYRITKNKYDNNLATTTDLLDADLARLQSDLNLAMSKVDAVVSYNKLLQSAGILLSESETK